MAWDGQERRKVCGSCDMPNRVFKLETYLQLHSENLAENAKTLKDINDKLSAVLVQQKVTHTLASFAGIVAGGITTFLGEHFIMGRHQ